MKTIGIKQSGGSDQLYIMERDKPELGKGDLLIKVAATGVNRTDILTRERETDEPENVRLGVEVAGTVVEAHSDSPYSVGDRVMSLVNGGGYSEYVTIPSDRVMRIPDKLSFVEGAAISEVFATAYQTLFWIGRLEENETVLIHAGASGVGTAAIQLAKQLKNAHVIVTAGSKEKLDFCRNLGADVVINYKEEAFDEVILAETEGRGVPLDGSHQLDSDITQKLFTRCGIIGLRQLPKLLHTNHFDIRQLIDQAVFSGEFICQAI